MALSIKKAISHFVRIRPPPPLYPSVLVSMCMRHFFLKSAMKEDSRVELISYLRPRGPELFQLLGPISSVQDDRTTLPDTYTYTAERDAGGSHMLWRTTVTQADHYVNTYWHHGMVSSSHIETCSSAFEAAQKSQTIPLRR